MLDLYRKSFAGKTQSRSSLYPNILGWMNLWNHTDAYPRPSTRATDARVTIQQHHPRIKLFDEFFPAATSTPTTAATMAATTAATTTTTHVQPP
jgi:hypothetical protein